MALKFIALSGTVGVTENLYVYESGNSMMVVDCGVGFPDIEMRGVDLVIPDFGYIVKNKHRLRGIIISQGHEDHQGALPFLLKKVSVPIYAPKLTAEFIKDKLVEHHLSAKINVYDPDRDTIDIHPFKIHPFRVSHSIPDTLGFAIDTPEGRIFHVPEHKFDPEPVDGMPFDIKKATELAQKDILFLASDCLGSNKLGSTPSEKHIESSIEEISKKAPKAIFFTTISSNIGRIQQAINVAQKLGRSVVIIGRSIVRKSEIARDLGYLKYSNGAVISPKAAKQLPANKLFYIVAGCYGQSGSSLSRIADNDHRQVKAVEGDTMIFSANPAPPFTKESIDAVVDNLIDMGVDVHYYDLHEDLYVSGHGSQEDIVKLFEIVKPKYFIPIGGTVRFMHGYEKLVEGIGKSKKDVFKLKPGEGLEFEKEKVQRTSKINVKEVLVDGLGIGDVGKVVLEDRKKLSIDGVAVVILKMDKASRRLVEDPEIISRGFVFQKNEGKFLKSSSKSLRSRIDKERKFDKKVIEEIVEKYLSEVFARETGRRPMVIPVVI